MNRQIDFYSDDWTALTNDRIPIALEDKNFHRNACKSKLSLEDVVPILRRPESMDAIELGSRGLVFSDGRSVPTLGKRIALLPTFLEDRLETDSFIFQPDDIQIPGYHYAQISSMKAKGDNTNLDPNDYWYQMHFRRASYFFKDIKGLTLDVGCGDPLISCQMLPDSADYIGLDPDPRHSDEFSICGIAETLPFKDSSLDVVLFNTSMDHILDIHTALEEAWRVLKTGGSIYVTVLIWHKSASLLYDNSHFHHFRQWEIQALLSEFSIDKFMKVDWKNNDNRFGVYIGGKKK